jgi:hypothetical protein
MAIVKLSAAATQAMGAALATDIGSAATIEIRTGAQPATPETAASGTLLATIPITGSFTSTGGVLTAADPGGITIDASGQAGHFRVKTSGGTAKLDGDVTVTAGTGSMKLAAIDLGAGATLDLGVPTITVPVQ